MSETCRVLTINTGSSSLKADVYRINETEHRELSASVERIGLPDSRFHVADGTGTTVHDECEHLPDYGAALRTLLDWLDRNTHEPLAAIGHRVVHGGKRYSEPQIVTGELVNYLRELVPIDPNHLPQAIAAILATQHGHPDLPHVACFDTAFHRQMNRTAQIYPLPRRWESEGIIRYGFHGLSCEYIMQELRGFDPLAASGRAIVAHLGNGASMTAIAGGRSVDTTMGFTPVGGLVMGTRSGDLDPGVLLYLLQEQGLTPDELSALVNRESGLLGVSGSSADMRDLLEGESRDRDAAEAVALFCYQARKFLGALAAALGGLDTLVFTGGIGEHAAPIRERICAHLAFLGIALVPERNDAHAAVISSDDGRVTVRVMKTNEDLMIARHTACLLKQGEGTHVRF